MSYEICIRVDDEGKISVGVEKEEEQGAAQEGGPGATSMGGEGEAEYAPVASIKEAMMKVMDIYQNDGAMDAGEDEFNAGFGSRKPDAAPIREQDEEEGRM